MGVEMESSAQRCPSLLVGVLDRRVHTLVPVGCARQAVPGRVSVSLRTLARRPRRTGGRGCPASPGRGACCSRPGGAGLRPIPAPAGLGGRADDGFGFESVDHRADHQRPGSAVRNGLGLVCEAAGCDTPPSAVITVALPAAFLVGADRPLPARRGAAVRCLAVPQRGEAGRAVLGGVPRRHGHHGDADFGGEVPHAVDDLSAHLLGHAGVVGAAHAECFHRAEVFNMDHRRSGHDGLIDSPTGGGPCHRVVEVGAAAGDVSDLVAQHLVPLGQGVIPGSADEAVVLVGLRVQGLALAADGAAWPARQQHGTCRPSQGPGYGRQHAGGPHQPRGACSGPSRCPGPRCARSASSSGRREGTSRRRGLCAA